MKARCFLGRRKISKPKRRRERSRKGDMTHRRSLLVGRPLQIPALYLSKRGDSETVRERERERERGDYKGWGSLCYVIFVVKCFF